MNGLAIFEAMNEMKDELIMSSVISKGSAGMSRKKHKPESAFRRFINSGWGVAAVCALVSLSVLGGIIWAGQQPWADPVAGTNESDADADADETVTDAGLTEDSNEETVIEDAAMEPIRITEFNAIEHLDLFTSHYGDTEITENNKLRIRGTWTGKELSNPYVTLNVFDLMKTSPAYATSEMKVPEMIFIKLTYENFGDLRFVHQNAVWGEQPDRASVQGAHIKLKQSPYDSDDVYLIIKTPNDERFENGDIPYLFFSWYLTSGEIPAGNRAVVFEEIIFYDNYASAVNGLTTRLNEDGYGRTTLNYKVISLGQSVVSKNEGYSQPFLSIPSKDVNGFDVIAVAEEAFQGNNMLYQVVVSEGIQRIGKNAFSLCDSLTEIYLPDSLLYIEDHAFDSSQSVREIYLGKNVIYVGSYAFPAFSNRPMLDIYYNGTIKEFQKIQFEKPYPSNAMIHCKDGDIPFSEILFDPSIALPSYAYKDMTDFLAKAEPPQLNPGETVVEMQAREIKVSKDEYTSLTYVLRYGIVAIPGEEPSHRLYFDILSAGDGKICKVGLQFDENKKVDQILSTRKYGGLIYMEPSYDGEDGVIYAYFYDETEKNSGRTLVYGYNACKIYYHKDHGILFSQEKDYEYAWYEEDDENRRTDAFISAGSTLGDLLSVTRPGGDGRLLAVITPCDDRVVFKPIDAPLVKRDLVGASVFKEYPFKDLLSLGLDGMYRKYGLYQKES